MAAVHRESPASAPPLQPYIEPAAGMTFARNLFAFLSTDDSAGMDISINGYTAATLAGSSSLMTNTATAAPYNFTNASAPALSDPVVKQLDWNLYYEAVHNASALVSFGWDTHALAGVNPLFVEPPSTADWNRTAADLALQVRRGARSRRRGVPATAPPPSPPARLPRLRDPWLPRHRRRCDRPPGDLPVGCGDGDGLGAARGRRRQGPGGDVRPAGA